MAAVSSGPVIVGNRAPQSSDGANGSFWLDTSHSPNRLYGPKASGAWPGGFTAIAPNGGQVSGTADSGAGGGGTVSSIRSGYDINVDNSDPANPIVGVMHTVPTVVRFDVTPDIPNLNNGVSLASWPGDGNNLPFQRASGGDLVFDIWVAVKRSFDGLTAALDIGTSTGMFTEGNGAPIDLTGQDFNGADNTMLVGGRGSALSEITSFRRAPAQWRNGVGDILVWVSADGTLGGANTGSVQGLAYLYIWYWPAYA